MLIKGKSKFINARWQASLYHAREKRRGRLGGYLLYNDFTVENILSGTFTRPSGSLWLDSDNNLRTAEINEPVYDGRRLSGDNWILASEGPCDTSPWVLNNGSGLATVTDNVVYFAAGGTADQIRQFNFPIVAGVRMVLGIDCRSIVGGSIFAVVFESGTNTRKGFYPTDGEFNYVMFEPTVTGTGYVLISQLSEASVPEVSFEVNRVHLSRDIEPTAHGKIVMIGDSLTFNGTALRLGEMYPTSGTTVVNAGIAGNTLVDMAARFDTDFLAQSPDGGIIWGGVNDCVEAVTSPVLSAFAAFEEMADKCEANNIPYGVGTISPWKGSAAWTAERQVWSDELNALIISSALTRGVHCVRMDQVFLGDTPQTLEASIAAGSDLIHPNSNGYYISASAFAEIFPREYPEYVKTTTSAPVNVTSPYDLSGNQIAGLKGISIHPAVVNKCQTYGFIPDDELGIDLFSGVPDSLGTGWTDNLDGTFTCDGTQTGNTSLPFFSSAVSSGKVNELAFTVSGYGAGSMLPNVGGDIGSSVTQNSSVTERLSPPAAATYVIFTADINFIGTVSLVSVKEVKYAVGTKSFHDGTSFIQNIDGMTLSGDVAGVLSIEQDTVALDAAGYGGPERNGKFLRLDNVLSTVRSTGDCSGVSANTNPHTLSVVSRGDGVLHLGAEYGVSKYIYSNPTFDEVHLTTTPTAVGRYLVISCEVGDTVDFLLPGLYEQTYAPYEPVPAVSLIDSTTQAATNLSYAYPAGSKRVQIPYTHWGLNAGSPKCIWSNETDAANYVGIFIDGTLAYIEKMVASVSEITSLPLALVQSTTYEFDAGFNPDNTMFISVDGIPHTVDGSTTLAPVLSGTMELGSLGGALQVDGQFGSLKLLRA